MGEFRCNPIIGQWVMVEDDAHSLGPQDYEKADQTRTKQAVCQFCEGREDQTPEEVDAVRHDGSPANGPGWSARVVPNRFPALRIEGSLEKRGMGIYDISNGIGAHEIVIETNDHTRDLADLSVDEIAGVLKLFQRRILSLAKDKRFKYIMIFKNFGRSAGTSVEHAHSQIIALPMVPRSVLAELEGGRQYFGFRGRCVYCDMIQQEYEDQERLVVDNGTFLAFCPYVPQYSFESWVIPKDHESHFHTLTDERRRQLAEVLKEILSRLMACLHQCSYNFYLHTAPVNYQDSESFHWHIEIVPQIARESGYEWGTGFSLVRTSPVKAAAYLKEVKV